MSERHLSLHGVDKILAEWGAYYLDSRAGPADPISCLTLFPHAASDAWGDEPSADGKLSDQELADLSARPSHQPRAWLVSRADMVLEGDMMPPEHAVVRYQYIHRLMPYSRLTPMQRAFVRGIRAYPRGRFDELLERARISFLVAWEVRYGAEAPL